MSEKSKKHKNQIDDDFQITVLSPSDDLQDSDSYKDYEKRLIAALKHELVFNIALTGIYGSGKSSVLNTFKKSHKDDWNFLDVSLSTFKVDKSEDEKSDDREENSTEDSETIEKEIPSLTAEQIQLIERSILQQFFYAVPQSEIPLSRFKRITENSKEEYKETFYVILIALWSYAYALGQLDFITNLLNLNKSFDYLNLVALIISTIYLIDKIYRYTFGLKEIKFNLHNAEFNIKNEEDKSILNDHLDEILYFFEATKKNVVIIEDLDRFNDTEIFIRLRELNSIINKSRPNNRVIFIYAIRDDIFEDSERSKFFDYIIPVIPIVDPTNAYDIVKKEYSDVADSLDNRFLRKTCLHFSDMRLLKNILNEYQSYLDQLDVLNIDKNKLFAIIVYKNYYPNEFAKLNSNDGEIYNLFNKEKKVLIERLIEAKQPQIDNLQTKKDAISNEKLNSVKELNSVYAYAILSELTSSFSHSYYNTSSSIIIEVNSIQYNVDTISNTEALQECAEHTHIVLSIINTSFKKSLKFNEIEKEVDPNNSYLDRLANITAKEK
ncbi:YobI family P-loop NTPase [Psychrobacter raelei]|uniref:YobI family P-loop NTPase n=1 Tax=Psychrobacter raelei TaxID=2565531 RepID=UPI003F633813